MSSTQLSDEKGNGLCLWRKLLRFGWEEVECGPYKIQTCMIFTLDLDLDLRRYVPIYVYILHLTLYLKYRKELFILIREDTVERRRIKWRWEEVRS